MIKKILTILLLVSFIVSQEPCDGDCFSDEEVQNLRTSILELENDVQSNEKIIVNLNSQIYMYIQSDSLYQSQITDYKQKLIYKDEMIDLVKPQWYENKYLWFGFGVIFTAGSVHLAGQVN